MKRAVKLLLLFAAAVLIGHGATIMAAPRMAMMVAMKRLSQDGQLVNAFAFGPRTTSNSRSVVRPTPDIAYSSCVYDLSGGPLLIEAAPTPGGGYLSISVFDANSDNIGVFDDRMQPQGIRFALVRAGTPHPEGIAVVESRSARGIMLDRRLAPTAAAFSIVDAARRADRCGPLENIK